jgi:hypothetical protein
MTDHLTKNERIWLRDVIGQEVRATLDSQWEYCAEHKHKRSVKHQKESRHCWTLLDDPIIAEFYYRVK